MKQIRNRYMKILRYINIMKFRSHQWGSSPPVCACLPVSPHCCKQSSSGPHVSKVTSKPLRSLTQCFGTPITIKSTPFVQPKKTLCGGSLPQTTSYLEKRPQGERENSIINSSHYVALAAEQRTDFPRFTQIQFAKLYFFLLLLNNNILY